MMSFLKNLFKKKEEVVGLEDLDKWFETNIKPESGEIKAELENIQRVKEELQKNLKVLEKVEIKEETQKKVKDVILGNVPAYIRAIEIFLERIKVPEETNSDSLIAFYETIQKELDSLGKKTARNFAIMQTLIGKELAITARNIKEIDESSKAMMKKTQKLKKIEDIKKRIDEIKEAKKNKIECERLRENYEKEKNGLLKEKSEAEQNIKKLEESKEAKELTQLNKDAEAIMTKKKDLDNEILSLFSPLQKAFKRYNNIFYIKKVEEYINNAAETLKQDSEMDILKYLQDIKKMINEDRIELKEDKKKKALESLEKLDENYLKKFIQSHNELNKEKKSVEDSIRQNMHRQKNEELHNEVAEKERRIAEIEKEIAKIKEINIKEHIREIEQGLKELGHEVKIHALD